MKQYKKEYFVTFGSSKQFPYQGGYIKIIAVDLQDAQRIFRKKYPDVTEGILNYSSDYTKKQFDDYLKNTKGDTYWNCCHNVICDCPKWNTTNNEDEYLRYTADAIALLVTDNYENGKIKPEIVSNVIETFGAERFSLTMAVTLNQTNSADLRISDTNREWAKKMLNKYKLSGIDDFRGVNAYNPGLMDAVVSKARRANLVPDSFKINNMKNIER